MASDDSRTEQQSEVPPTVVNQSSVSQSSIGGQSPPVAAAHSLMAQSPMIESPPTPGTPSSRSGTRHKCPHCDQSFTRQHNLKSHLLTHSHERPYSCALLGCAQKFRRMHDKKRHEKLHTGEKSFTCNMCLRTFARGDALSRHQKGPTGCVGRVSSIGGADDRFDDSMDSVSFTQEGGSSRKRPRQSSLPHMRSDETSPRRDFNPLESGRNQPQGSTYPPITQFRTQQQPLEPYYNHTINAQSPFDPRLSRISQPPTPSFPPSSIVLPGQPNGPPAGPILGQASSITESPAPLTPGTGPTQAPDNRKDSMATQMQKTQLNSRRSTIQSPQPFGGMAPPLKSPGHHPTLPSIHSLPPPSHTLPSQQGPPTGLPNFGAPLPPGQQSSGSSQYQPHSLPNPGVPSGSGSMSSQSQGSRQNTEPGSGAGYIGIDVPSLIKLVKDLEVEVGDLRRRVISLESQLTVANGGGGGGSGKGPAMAGQL